MVDLNNEKLTINEAIDIQDEINESMNPNWKDRSSAEYFKSKIVMDSCHLLHYVDEMNTFERKKEVVKIIKNVLSCLAVHRYNRENLRSFLSYDFNSKVWCHTDSMATSRYCQLINKNGLLNDESFNNCMRRVFDGEYYMLVYALLNMSMLDGVTFSYYLTEGKVLHDKTNKYKKEGVIYA